MRILLVHNRRANRTGEDTVVDFMQELLRSHGHDVETWLKDNADLRDGLRPKLEAFLSGFGSRDSAEEMDRRLRHNRPDIVHIHNIHPWFSTSIFAVCARHHVPAVYHCHNHQFSCPTTFQFRQGEPCFKCAAGNTVWCAIHNCQGTRSGSIAYAVRGALTRRTTAYRDLAGILVPSRMLREQLVSLGFTARRVHVLPNPVMIPPAFNHAPVTSHAAYIGRLSAEKGVEILLRAARLTPEIPVCVAGSGPEESNLRRLAPSHVRFLGYLGPADRDHFYREARFGVVPSLWHEPFGLAAAEPMAYGIPVIASNRGGLPEIVHDQESGILVPPGDPQALADAMRWLWSDDDVRHRLGKAAREQAVREFSGALFLKRLIEIYQAAMLATEELAPD